MKLHEYAARAGEELQRAQGLVIAVLYGITSASMAFVNKGVLTAYGFSYPLFLVTCQMVFSIVLIETLRLTGRVSLPRYTLSRGYAFLVPSTCYAINSVLALSALSAMNIPMYGVIKRCAPVMILLLGAVMLGKGLPSRPVVISVATITLGCFIAGYGDLTFDLVAYAYGFSSVVSQALYLILVQKNAKDMGATETLYLNSYNTLPLLLLACVVFGEHGRAADAFLALSGDASFLALFSTVISVGCALNYLLFLCTTYNSALTTSVTGTLKSIIQTAVGMFTFGGIHLNACTVIGIVMNLSGGICYSVAKYRDGRRKGGDSPGGTVVSLPSSACVVDMSPSKHTANGNANGKVNGTLNGLNGVLKKNGHNTNGLNGRVVNADVIIVNGQASYVGGQHHL